MKLKGIVITAIGAVAIGATLASGAGGNCLDNNLKPSPCVAGSAPWRWPGTWGCGDESAPVNPNTPCIPYAGYIAPGANAPTLDSNGVPLKVCPAGTVGRPPLTPAVNYAGCPTTITRPGDGQKLMLVLTKTFDADGLSVTCEYIASK